MFQGVLKKMQTEFTNPIQYYLCLQNDFINVNQLLNKTLELSYIKYECLGCGKDKPIFRQGFCKQCFFDLPQAADWIMRPELSKAHLGIEDRDLAYEKQVQLQSHIVYLANSSNLKVGVTRESQIPTRWIDQGAHEAIPLLKVPNRYLAGLAEVSLKPHVSDKTNWRKMLTNHVEDVDLIREKKKLSKFIPKDLMHYLIDEYEQEVTIHFPVLQYPTKVKSLNLVNRQRYQGTLVGIKGQYLIFEDQTVFNIRSNEGLYIGLITCP
ncbi:DUF2797 domain-containing protein [Flavobacteriaceae bacterium F08102]|nr:DUF2797 domain-containing protein [Flavobacteriaceae bacterium F08102]